MGGRKIELRFGGRLDLRILMELSAIIRCDSFEFGRFTMKQFYAPLVE